MPLGTIVDSNVLLDIFTDDKRWGDWSATHLARGFDAGPVIINPIIYAELSVGWDRIEDLDDELPHRIERENLPWDAAFLAAPGVPTRRHAPITVARLLHRRPRSDD